MSVSPCEYAGWAGCETRHDIFMLMGNLCVSHAGAQCQKLQDVGKVLDK